MILSAQSIERRCLDRAMIQPFHYRTKSHGLTFGLGPCGYDVRLAQPVVIPASGFVLASTLEQFNMPDDLVARVHDKSTWARLGIFVQNTIIEPGWRGYLTLELSNSSRAPTIITEGVPIAQIIFELLDRPTMAPYQGKYQDQQHGPQGARFE